MKIKFTKRNEYGLHCRFCHYDRTDLMKLDMFETSPIKGIVCRNCKKHLEAYLNPNKK